MSILALLLGATALGAAPPEADPIRLPFVEVVAPTPPPRTVTALAAEQLYVIDSDVELRVLASPEGVVNVAADGGPIKIRGKFVENTSGKVTTRTYKGPFVYTVEAATTGKVELLIVRTDGKGAVIRRTLDVTAGEGPLPPPKPKPDPDPKPPEPKPEPAAAKVVVVVVEETQQRTPAQGKVLFDKGVRDWLKAGGHEIELLDRDDPAAKGAGYLPYANAVGLPAVLVFDAGATGAVIPLKTFKLPATAGEFQTAIKGAVK